MPLNQLWWHLPGPAGYIRRAIDYIQEGCNVILQTPLNFPQGLTNALRAVYKEQENLRWILLNCPKADQNDPAKFISSQLSIDADDNRSIEGLLESASFQGNLIFVTGFNEDQWRAWTEFIVEYEHACRPLNTLRRTLFILQPEGPLGASLPNNGICLKCHRWDGAVNELDMALFVSTIIPDTVTHLLERRLTISIVTQLARWDRQLAENLVGESLETLLEPKLVLQQYASSRGWCGSSVNDCACLNGSGYRFGGEFEVHSAMLAAKNQDRELHRRIWKAELSILLPFVEELRV